MIKQRFLPRIIFSLAGGLLVGTGLAGDLLAGKALLEHAPWTGLLLHLLAMLAWILGMLILNPGLDAAALPALFLFPGLGILAWSLAGGLSLLMPRPTGPAGRAWDVPPAGELPGLPPGAPDLARQAPAAHLAIPLVETLHAGDPGLKRAALGLIYRTPTPQSARLARRFLADPDLDVRALAAIALARHETRLGERLQQARKQIKAQPQAPAPCMAAGQAYAEAAAGSEAGSVQRRLYLDQARQAFEKAAALDPRQPEAHLRLAETLHAMGEPASAWEAVQSALAAAPAGAQAYRLAMEIALGQGRFEQVSALARQASASLPAGELASLDVLWWLEQEDRHAQA